MTSSLLSATEFTIGSFNAGGLSDHYDYIRAASMQKLMEERYREEPDAMSLNEKIQKLALKILFARDPLEQAKAQQAWNQNGYSELIKHLTADPGAVDSPSTNWFQRANSYVTPWNVRPVQIMDGDLNDILEQYLNRVSLNPDAGMDAMLLEVRSIMAETLFSQSLRFDILALQETNYLDVSLFPSNYEVLLLEASKSDNGLAWNAEKFELVENLGYWDGGIGVILRDKESGETLLVVSGHLKGSNPYRVVTDPATGRADSARGDAQLEAIIQILNETDADIKIIGMDSNVTSLHPRMNILKDAGFLLDYENELDPTNTSPYQLLNNRIDWIAIKTQDAASASITNLPIPEVGLNHIQSNISDHKPIAAKVILR